LLSTPARVSAPSAGRIPRRSSWPYDLGPNGSASRFVDQASGARNDRAGLRAILDAAHRREFDGVLVWALDRLSREGIGAMVAYLEKSASPGSW
jgi:hypothetical protein